MRRAMGAWRRHGKAAVCAALLCLATRSGASTVTEPIARLSLESGYDTNPLYDGQRGGRMDRISPEAGLRMRDHLWDARLEYRGDWLRYSDLAPGGMWNHRGALSLETRPTARVGVRGALRGSWAFDPVGLAQAGVFRSGRQSAFLLSGKARAEYAWSRRVDTAATFVEQTVRFEDGTGGAIHAPGVEALWRSTRRLSLGGGYGFGAYQTFDPGERDLAFSHGLKGRARWRASRRLTFEASAGPAVWLASDDAALVPEASLEAFGSSRAWHYRLAAAHGLGIGATARPGLVDSIEAAGERRFGRRWILRGDGGVWHSGRAPSGGDSATGFAVAGEAGLLVGMNVRIALAATQFARLDDPAPEFRRTYVGLRLGWALPAR